MKKSKKISPLISDKIQTELDTYGFSTIDILNTEELQKLSDIYNKYKTKIDTTTSNGIHMTNWISNRQIKYSISQEIESCIHECMNKILQNYTSLNHVFIVKNKHSSSNFPIHQDWSFVNEDIYDSINIWIPLQDTNQTNGGIYFIPGSHLLKNNIRGAGKLTFDFTPYYKKLKKHFTPVTLKKGQILLFYHSTIHGSTPNKSDNPRIIVAASVIHKDANIIINNFDEQSNTLRRFVADKEFMFNYENIRTESLNEVRNGKLIESLSNYKIPNIKYTDIVSLIPHTNTIQSNWKTSLDWLYLLLKIK